MQQKAEFEPAELNSTTSKRLLFLELMEDSKIPYTLVFGSLLGAIRHHGIIPYDYDIDIDIYPLMDHRFDGHKSRNDIGFVLATILSNLTENNPKYKDIMIIKGAYQSDPIAFCKNNPKLFHEAEWNSHYLSTLTLVNKTTPRTECNQSADPITKEVLNYPFVMDIGYGYWMSSEKKYSQYGPLCRCKFNDMMTNCLEFSHIWMEETFGTNYMVPLNYTKDLFGNRIYDTSAKPTDSALSITRNEKELYKAFKKTGS